MIKHKIKIGTKTDIDGVLQDFKEACEQKNIKSEEVDSLYNEVESVVHDLTNRGRKLVEIGSHFHFQQTVENSICNVLIDIDLGPESQSFFDKIKRLLKTNR